MKLRAVYKTLEEVPEQFRDLYTKVGEDFVLDVDDSDFKTKISEFRDNNLSLRKQVEDAASSEERLKQMQDKLSLYGDMDPEEAKKALEDLQQVKDKKMLDEGKIEELFAERTERMRADYGSKIEALEKALDSVKTSEAGIREKLHKTVIDTSLQNAVSNVATVRKGAMQDILSRGRGVWMLDDEGNPVPRSDDGKVMYGPDPAKPITMEEWAQGLVLDAGYLFEGSKGGGAGGGMDDSGAEGYVDVADSRAVSDNLEQIASGEIKVTGT